MNNNTQPSIFYIVLKSSNVLCLVCFVIEKYNKYTLLIDDNAKLTALRNTCWTKWPICFRRSKSFNISRLFSITASGLSRLWLIKLWEGLGFFCSNLAALSDLFKTSLVPFPILITSALCCPEASGLTLNSFWRCF